MRRTHSLGLAIGIVLIYLLFFSGSSTTDFRGITEASLSRRRGILRGSLSDAALTAKTNRDLQQILDKYRQMTDASTLPRGDQKNTIPDTAINHAVGGAGQKNDMSDSEKTPQAHAAEPAANGVRGPAAAVPTSSHQAVPSHSQAEDVAREELQNILKKSPIIIFSKSYCPYSKRAKALLLETYSISPAPYVVELDLMTTPLSKDAGDHDDAPPPTLGRGIQTLLASLTGRKTVPNILINAHSIGGSDDVARLHQEGKLADEIRKQGGKRIVSIKENTPSKI